MSIDVTDPTAPQLADARVPLSVLDLATVVDGQTSADALADSTTLARTADRLGYRRHWVAEHHNMAGVASTAPPVLLAHLAAATERIRVGSGGVMLPNHPPLVVAEQFAILEALHPGRIDLGLGRAPGTDPGTAQALRRAAHQGELSEFAREIVEVHTLLNTPATDGALAATPRPAGVPELWVLGSSQSSAIVAAALGVRYAFAHHFSGESTVDCVELYRSRFQPSDVLDAPHVLVTANVVVAASDDLARRNAMASALSFAELRRGVRRPLRTLEQSEAHTWDPMERAFAESRLASSAVGSAPTATRKLQELVSATGAQELMISVHTPDVASRIETLERLAVAWPAAELSAVRSS